MSRSRGPSEKMAAASQSQTDRDRPRPRPTTTADPQFGDVQVSLGSAVRFPKCVMVREKEEGNLSKLIIGGETKPTAKTLTTFPTSVCLCVLSGGAELGVFGHAALALVGLPAPSSAYLREIELGREGGRGRRASSNNGTAVTTS